MTLHSYKCYGRFAWVYDPEGKQGGVVGAEVGSRQLVHPLSLSVLFCDLSVHV